MTTFDGWDARVNGVGQSGRRVGASMMSRDAPGWAMTYQGDMAHGGTFGRGHYRGDRGTKLLYGSQAYSRQLAARTVVKPVYSEQGIVGGFEWRSPNHLNHFRTKGSKNGVRRYQNEDGSWTPLGLKERRVREGFGERRAARKEARAKRREERAASRVAVRKYVMEQRRLRNPKNMTDDELRKGIERKKLEQEYRELNEGTAIKAARFLVTKYAEYRVNKMEREMRAEERRYQYAKMQVDMINKRRQTTADIARAKADTAKAKADILEIKKGGRKASNEAKLVGAKLAYRNTTIRGGIGAAINKMLKGAADQHVDLGKLQAETIGDIRNRQAVDRYNSKTKRRMAYTKTADQRTEDKYRQDLAVEKEHTMQEKYRVDQEKNKSKSGRGKK